MEKGRGIHRTLNSVIFRTVANPGFNCVGVRRHCTSILLFLSPLLSLPPPTHSTVPPPPPPPKVVFGGFQFHSILLLLLLSTSPPAVNTLPLPLPLPFHPKGTFFSGNLLAFVSFSLVVRRYRLESRLLLLLLLLLFSAPRYQIRSFLCSVTGLLLLLLAFHAFKEGLLLLLLHPTAAQRPSSHSCLQI